MGLKRTLHLPLWSALLLCALLTATLTWALTRHIGTPQKLTQDDINAAVLHTLNTQDLPSRAARAAQLIAPSVVHVRTQDEDKKNPKGGLQDSGVGSGVVISEEGVILTNLHVVQGAKRIQVTFADGTESEALVIGVQPENDLAVIKAKRLPDDLQPATLGSSQNLQPGDEVVAVGFPFGIGPSVSAGVVSGLNRSFGSEGKTMMRGLIQADAKFIDDRDDIAEYIRGLPVGQALDEDAIRNGFDRFKVAKKQRVIADIAKRHGLATDALQGFVDGVLRRRIFDGDALSELMAPLDLGWKARTQKELALMEDLTPLLHKLAQGREISGLSAYEQ